MLLAPVFAKAQFTIVDSTVTNSLCSVISGGGQCNGDGEFSLEVLADGGTPTPFDFFLIGPTSSAVFDTYPSVNFTGLCPGDYDVVILNGSNFPIGTVEFTIIGSAAISTSATPSDVSCVGENDGSVDLTITGGTAPINVTWSNGETTEDISGLSLVITPIQSPTSSIVGDLTR